MAVALIILVSLDYHIHVTFYLGNDGVMTRWSYGHKIHVFNNVKAGELEV